MNGIRIWWVRRLDRATAIGLAGVIFGTAAAFGGAAWWGRPYVAGAAFALGLAWFLRCGLTGRWPVLFSPLGLLGALAIGLGAAQLVPWPGAIASLASPNARAAHSIGTLPRAALEDDPAAELPAPFTPRSPLTLDRSATLRWIVGASALLMLFWVVSHFTDRLRRLSLIWGSIVAAFLLNGAIATVQLAGFADGIYGFVTPGSGPRWAMNPADALAAPGRSVLRPVPTAADVPRAWVFPRPVPRSEFGTMPGGADAFLALGSLGLPLSLALTLQLMAPRGSREPFWARLRRSSRGSLLILLFVSTILAAGLVGLLAGRFVALPFAIGLGIVGLPCLFGAGLGFRGFLLTTLTAAALGGGIALGDAWPTLIGDDLSLPRVDLDAARRAWATTPAMLRDFPIVGVGLGARAVAATLYEPGDAASSTAESTLAQWAVEGGAVGLALLGLALFWVLVRLPSAFARVGSADRALACGFLGAAVGFLGFAAMRWSVELPAVAVAAVVFAGTLNRWLAGGTDLLVEALEA
ncbi:MAG: O-antigen ligase domain-containing protein [Isosphaeraceae bacterium]|nr:O-antigen ligase domain-containing protein [Isosphaeraceae bacterium]